MFCALLRKAADSIDAAVRFIPGNRSVSARLGFLAMELRVTADGFEGTIDAKA